jgi:hypothetical protein
LKKEKILTQRRGVKKEMKDELEFYDVSTKQIMMIKVGGAYKGWLFRKHPDGQWVIVREATKDDINAILKITEKSIGRVRNLIEGL